MGGNDDAEVLGGDVLEEVRLVHDQRVVGRDHLAEARLPDGEIGAQQVVVDDYEIRLDGPLAHHRDEASVEIRARLPDAVFARGGDLSPEIDRVGKL